MMLSFPIEGGIFFNLFKAIFISFKNVLQFYYFCIFLISFMSRCLNVCYHIQGLLFHYIFKLLIIYIWRLMIPMCSYYIILLYYLMLVLFHLFLWFFQIYNYITNTGFASSFPVLRNLIVFACLMEVANIQMQC